MRAPGLSPHAVAGILLLLLLAALVTAPTAPAKAPHRQVPPTVTPTPDPGGMGPLGPGSSSGDPHLRTPDGLAYDFQAAGEFVLVQATAGDLTVQVRQEPVGTSTVASMNTAVAMSVAGDRVGLDVTGAAPLAGQRPAHPARDRGAAAARGWPGDAGRGALHNWLAGPERGRGDAAQPVPRRGGAPGSGLGRAGGGLLGNADGTAGNDLATRDGRVVDLAGLAPAGHARAALRGVRGQLAPQPGRVPVCLRTRGRIPAPTPGRSSQAPS